MDRELRQLIQSDLYRHMGSVDRKAFCAAFLRVPGFRYCYFLRKCAHYRNKKGPLAAAKLYANRLALHRYRFRYGFGIGPGTAIGEGLYLGHFGGVTISHAAVLGTNVNISQGVTIGAILSGKREGAPVIGDRVWIGANAIVVGGIRIGDDALIAPGAFVNFDVPAKATVIGNPGSIVGYRGSEEYINHPWPGAKATSQG